MSDIKCIVDTIGRTVVGKITDENDTTITLNNPVIIHVQPDQQNRAATGSILSLSLYGIYQRR